MCNRLTIYLSLLILCILTSPHDTHTLDTNPQCITVPLQGFLNSIIYGLTVDDIGDSIMGDFMIKLHSQKNSDFHNISIEYGTDDGDDDETRSIIRS